MSDKLNVYFKGDELAASAWKGKYAIEGEETPDDMHIRLAREFAKIEEDYKNNEHKAKELSPYGQTREFLSEERILYLFKDFKYIIPQGSVMSQLGAPSIGSLSNCFFAGEVIDSYGGIMKMDETLVQLMKRRAGVGTDISNLRPKGTPTSNAAKSSTGAISFMHRFSNTTREVAQNGRRGALMISIHVNHPDVVDFAQIKRDLTKVTGANISVKFNEEFMRAVENDEDYYLRFPVDTDLTQFSEDYLDHKYNELAFIEDHNNDNNIVWIKKVRAKEVWNEIIKSAHGVAEPGLMFWDNAIEYSPDGLYEQFKPKGTNPCGEITLAKNDSCRLIAVNLFSFVVNPFTDEAFFDFDKFYEVNYEAMRLSDNLVDLEIKAVDRIINKIKNDPETDDIKRSELELWEDIREVGKNGRRTGLGFTALGDALAAVGLKYDSDEALSLIEEISKVKLKSELDCTIDLAQLRGTFIGHSPHKEFDYSNGVISGKNRFYQFLCEEYPEQANKMFKYGRRNVSSSTIAPTGTVSLLTQTTSGLEPLFMGFYMRRKKVNPNDENVRVDFTDDNGDTWQEFPVLHPKFKDWITIQNKEGRILETVSEMTNEQLQHCFELSPWFGSTANDIDWVKRVEIQGILQKYITHSISSTINLPNDVKEEEVSTIYMESWKKGLKGITVYRDGSRSGVLVSSEKKEETTRFHDNHAPRRPKSLDAKVVRFSNNKEKWIAFVGLMDNKPYEIFTGKVDDIKIPPKVEDGQIVKVKDEDGVKRYDFVYEDGTVEGIGSVFNPDFWNYAKLVSGALRHGMPLHFAVDMIIHLNFAEDHINTWKNGVARTLKRFIPDGEVKGLKCDDCGGRVRFEGGCAICQDCGGSKCS